MKTLFSFSFLVCFFLAAGFNTAVAAGSAEASKSSTSKSGKNAVTPVPKGYHTLTAYVSLKDCKGAMDFYKRAFGAEERECLMAPDGKRVMHAEMQIGDSILMLSDDFFDSPAVDPKTVQSNICNLHLYVPDVDAVYDRAIKAGAIAKMPVADMFWGDRYGSLADPFGLVWSIGTHKADLSKEEVARRGEEYFKTVGKDIMDKIKNNKELTAPVPQ